MELTMGEMLFYGGLAGMAAILVASAIIAIILGSSRRRLRRKLGEEYGRRMK